MNLIKVVSITEKIESLNNYCGGSLGVTHFTGGWEISSYRDRTLFKFGGRLWKEKNRYYLKSKFFSDLIDMAYGEMLEDMKRKSK